MKSKVAIYEKSTILLALLKITFKGNTTYELVDGFINKINLLDKLKSEPIDTLILSHQGVLDLDILKLINENFPSVRIIGVYYDEGVFKNITSPLLCCSVPKSTSVDECLQRMQTIHFN